MYNKTRAKIIIFSIIAILEYFEGYGIKY